MSVSVLGGVKSGERVTDAYERTRKDFQAEIISEVEKMSRVMRQNLLKLRKESKRIEFMTVTGQMRALNEIKVKDMKAAEDAVAGNLLEAENLERSYLSVSQDEDAKNKTKIQGIKKEMKRIITLIKELHMQANASKTAAQIATKVQSLIEEKREAMAGAAARLDERERKERLALDASHVRLANNLMEWQRLELQGFDEGEQDRVRRVNKLRASQLKEVQQKESEQLKEIQRLKASSLVVMNDLDLEHLMSIEALRAAHVGRLQEMDKVHRNTRRDLKENIKQLKNESRARVLSEQFSMTAENLVKSQNDRAEKLRTTNENKRLEAASALENEVLLKLEDLEASLENMGEYLSSDSERTGSSKSKSTNKSTSSKGTTSQVDGQENATTAIDENGVSQTENGTNVEDKLKTSAEGVVDLLKKDDYEHSSALSRAEARLASLQQENELAKQKELKVQEQEIEAALNEYEERRKKILTKNEQSLFNLMKQHSQDKLELTKNGERDMEAVVSAIMIEKEFHSTRVKAEEYIEKQRNMLKSLLTRIADAGSGGNEKLGDLIAQLHRESSDTNAVVFNLLEYTGIVQSGSKGAKVAQDVKSDLLVSEMVTYLKGAIKDNSLTGTATTVLKFTRDKTIQPLIRLSVRNLQTVLSKLLDQIMYLSSKTLTPSRATSEIHFSVTQKSQRLLFTLEDKTSSMSIPEYKMLEKAVNNTSPTLGSNDVRSCFGIMIANMVSKNMDGEIMVKSGGGAATTSGGSGGAGLNGIALTLSIPATKVSG